MGLLGTAIVAGATYYLTKHHVQKQCRQMHSNGNGNGNGMMHSVPAKRIVGQMPASTIVMTLDEDMDMDMDLDEGGMFGCSPTHY